MQISDMENEMKKIISPDSGLETEAAEDAVKGPEAAAAREKAIVRTSVIGIVANVFLAGFKALVGAASGSIAIILDAVNNLSDAMSSVITILGTKLARKAPDKKHPLGYGRIEYLSAMIVAAIVLYAGITSFTESLKKIIHPEAADYSAATLIILASAIVVKLILGRYVKSVGEREKSGSLIASGSDASFDAILSASVLASAIIYLLTKVSLEAWVGLVIAVIIIKSGIEMMRDTISQVLGERPDASEVAAIKKAVASFPEVHGAYDLVLHDYGPDKRLGSLHIEIPDTMTAEEIDTLERHIQKKIYQEFGVILTGIGIYSMNTKNDECAKMRDHVRNMVLSHDGVLQFHGFYVNRDEKYMSFDAVLSFDCDRDAEYQAIMQEVQAAYPDYSIVITADVDTSGSYDRQDPDKKKKAKKKAV